MSGRIPVKHLTALVVDDSELLQSTVLRKAGNILGSAYLTALANLMSMILTPSAPTVTTATWGAVLEQAGHKDASVVLCASAKFRMSPTESPSLIGRLLHVADSVPLATILKTIGWGVWPIMVILGRSGQRYGRDPL